MATGTAKVIGFLMATQRPLNEYYLNEGVAWVNSAAVLAGIPSGARSDGMLVKIGLELWWFKADLTTLEKVPINAATTAANVAITDTGSLYTATEVEAALAEVKTAHNALAALVSGFGTGTKQTTYRIDFTTASGSVAARVAGAIETTDYPTGWTLAVNAVYNLLITHTLTDRKLSTVNVYEIDGSDERLLPQFSEAFSGVICNGLTVLIEGLAPTGLAIRIELIFN